MAGDDDHAGLAPGLALEQRSTPAAATISFSGARPITKALPSGPGGLAGEAGGDHAGGDDLLLVDLDAQLPQPLRVGGRELGRVVGDEDDPLARREQRGERLRRTRNRLAADPDDPVEVDQKSVEVVRQCHGPQAIGSISIRCRP